MRAQLRKQGGFIRASLDFKYPNKNPNRTSVAFFRDPLKNTLFIKQVQICILYKVYYKTKIPTVSVSCCQPYCAAANSVIPWLTKSELEYPAAMSSLPKEQHNGTGVQYSFPTAWDLRLWIGHFGVFTVCENETKGG